MTQEPPQTSGQEISLSSNETFRSRRELLLYVKGAAEGIAIGMAKQSGKPLESFAQVTEAVFNNVIKEYDDVLARLPEVA